MYCDINHYIKCNYGEVKVVDSGFQSVDMNIVNECKENDIVIISRLWSSSYMPWEKMLRVLSPKGYIYNNENIGAMLEQRHLNQRIRSGGGRIQSVKEEN